MNESKKKRTVQLHTFARTRTEIKEVVDLVDAPNENVAEKLIVNGDPSVRRLAPPIYHTVRTKTKQLPDPKPARVRR